MSSVLNQYVVVFYNKRSKMEHSRIDIEALNPDQAEREARQLFDLNYDNTSKSYTAGVTLIEPNEGTKGFR